MNASTSIIIGVISGVITAAIIWLIINIFKKILIPFYEGLIYKGIDINGKWECTEEQEVKESDCKTIKLKYEYSLIFNQHGHYLKGTYVVKNISPDNVDTSEYTFNGIISDNYISINYYRANKKRIGIGSFLLKVCIAGNGMYGHLAFVEMNTTEVSTTTNLLFKRHI